MKKMKLNDFMEDKFSKYSQLGDNSSAFISDSANELIDLKHQKEKNKRIGKEINEKINICEKNLGNALSELGIDNVGWKDGQIIKCKQIYSTKFKGSNPEEVDNNENEWNKCVSKAGDDSFLSHTFVIKLKITENAEYVRKILNEANISFDEQSKMPWNTREKYIRLKLEEGESIPGENYIELTTLNVAKILKGK